jgi:hypothetical protein
LELAERSDLRVYVIIRVNESQELEVKLAGASAGCDPVMISRDSAGTHCQIAYDQWMKIGRTGGDHEGNGHRELAPSG